MVFGSLAVSAPALADPDEDYINTDRPGIADGSTTVGRRHFQVETAVQYEIRQGGDDHTTFIPTLLRYGFADRWEVRIEGNGYIWEKQVDPVQGTTNFHGFAPASVGLKYNFLDAIGSKQPSVGAIVRIFPPSDTGAFRNTRTTGDFRVAADWNFADKWSLNPNVGVGVYQDKTNSTYTAGLFAATLNFNPSKVLRGCVRTAS